METINNKVKKITVTTRIPAELARKMRIHAAYTGENLEDCYTIAIRQYLDWQDEKVEYGNNT